MALTLKRAADGGGDKQYELCPAGNHLAVLYGIVDLGTQDHPWAQDQSKRWFREVRFIWETSDERMSDGRPFSVGESFRLSLHEKANLSKIVEGMTGARIKEEDDVELRHLIGTPCMVNVVHARSKKDPAKVFANVEGVGPLPKRMQHPDQVNDDLYYDLDMGAPGDDVPEWLRKKILASRELAEPAGPALPPARTTPITAGAALDEGDKIPF